MTFEQLEALLKQIDPNVQLELTDTDTAWFVAYFSIPVKEQ